MPDKEREEYVRVLDFLPQGHPGDDRPAYQKEPLIQGVGENSFVLLELVPRKDEQPNINDRLYVGEGDREVVDHVKRRIGYGDLTTGAKDELPYVVEEIVKENPEPFLDFFNRAQPITTRQHMLELLQGIGKKLMWNIIDERKGGDFESLEDLEERVDGLHNPAKIVAKRVVEEVKDEDVKYHAFTRDSG